MISKEDFAFTVGYQGDTAIVDGISRNRYGKLSILELAEEGMFKPALCMALFSGKEEDFNTVLTLYNEHAQRKVPTIEELKKVYGVSKPPEEIVKVIRL
ncbi:MAG: hypothetical protein JXJ04_20170 [Spirochaetales bacterium]|nr:hypothetical protein [Spirochaetales bacterium]